MPVYWSILVFTIFICLCAGCVNHREVVVENQVSYRMPVVFLAVYLAFLCFFMGMRDRVLDTAAYVYSFEQMPDTWDKMLSYVAKVDSGKGFYLLEGVFKILVSHNHYVWLTFLSVISCVCLFRVLYKYSVDCELTCYLFIAGATFTWLLNGSRQFLAVCILFSCTDWLIENKKMRYILAALLLTTIHSSVIFVAIISIFVSSKKIFSVRLFVFSIITVVGVRYSDDVLTFLGFILNKDYSDQLLNGSGANIINMLIASVPILIVIFRYRFVEETAPPSIKLAVNMSWVGVCFYFAAAFTDGILVGRMPIYFTVYNLYLLPWLIQNCFPRGMKEFVRFLCMAFYFILFYYKLVIAWDGLNYTSEILGLYF